MREWSDEELRLLDKAVAKYPQGTPKRWEQVGGVWWTPTNNPAPPAPPPRGGGGGGAGGGGGGVGSWRFGRGRGKRARSGRMAANQMHNASLPVMEE
jgi:hypothetical protein